MKSLTTGQLAKAAQVNVETIRYYERQGLMPEPPRRTSGYRQYSKSDVGRLLFIKEAKNLGFSLQEISGLLSLRVDPVTSCQEVRKLAETKIAQLEEKIQAMQRIKKALTKLASACKVGVPDSECPILDALDLKSLRKRETKGAEK